MLNLLSPIFLGALLNLDRQIIGPFMLNRPLVAGLLAGFLIGDVEKGVWLGLSVELLWLGSVPLGGAISPNSGLAVTAALASWLWHGLFTFPGAFPAPGTAGDWRTQAVLTLLFVTVPVWAKIFTLADLAARLAVPKQVEAARADLMAGREPHFFRRNFMGVIINFAGGLLALLIAVPANMFFLKLMAMFAPAGLLEILAASFGFIPFLGLFGMAVLCETKALTHYFAGLLAGLLVLSAI